MERAMAQRILVVDDEKTICELLAEALGDAGYIVRAARNVSSAWDLLTEEKFDLVVLDIMMPVDNGFDLLRRMRREKKMDTPVILLTGVSTEDDKLRAFELGADDYVVKPFSLPEFIARVKAVLRRAEANIPSTFTFGHCKIDRSARLVFRSGEEVKLRLKEYQILAALTESPGVAIGRQDLFKQIWGDDSPSGEKTVDVTIHTLREKIEDDPTNPHYIQTVRGFGYRFTPEREASAKD
jgi:DNA-binding response OmpR family regulator